MADTRKEMGRAAEDAAAAFLKKEGLKILARNFSTPRGEVDIIAADKDTICFIEVRSVSSTDITLPEETIRAGKERRIRNVAGSFLALKRLDNRLCRFDVMSMIKDPSEKSGWNITHLRDAF